MNQHLKQAAWLELVRLSRDLAQISDAVDRARAAITAEDWPALKLASRNLLEWEQEVEVEPDSERGGSNELTDRLILSSGVQKLAHFAIACDEPGLLAPAPTDAEKMRNWVVTVRAPNGRTFNKYPQARNAREAQDIVGRGISALSKIAGVRENNAKGEWDANSDM